VAEVDVDGLRLAPLRVDHAQEARAACAELEAEGFPFLLGLDDDDNIASAAVIERCGGVLEDVIEPEPGAPPVRRYWIR